MGSIVLRTYAMPAARLLRASPVTVQSIERPAPIRDVLRARGLPVLFGNETLRITGTRGGSGVRRFRFRFRTTTNLGAVRIEPAPAPDGRNWRWTGRKR